MEKRVKEIWSKYFGDDLDFLNKYFSIYYEPNNLIINSLSEGKEFIYMALIVRYEYKYNDEKIPIGYVTAVLTNPQYRNQGYFRVTMQEVFQRLIDNNYIISCLIPASEELKTTYIRYGYSNCFTTTKLPNNNKSILHRKETFQLYKDLNYDMQSLKANPNAMLRIVDVQKVLELFASQNPSIEKRLKVIDNQISSNNNSFEIKQGKVIILERSDDCETISISDLAYLIFENSYMDLMFDK